MIRLSGQGQNVSARIRRTLTLRRRAADTDAREIRDALVVRGGTCGIIKHISQITSAPTESIGALQVILIEVENTLPIQVARNRERHGAVAAACGGWGVGRLVRVVRVVGVTDHLWAGRLRDYIITVVSSLYALQNVAAEVHHGKTIAVARGTPVVNSIVQGTRMR